MGQLTLFREQVTEINHIDLLFQEVYCELKEYTVISSDLITTLLDI